MSKEEIVLKSEFITLSQAIKVAGYCGSGAEAKHLVRGGDAKVNGVVCIQPGKKLRAGDRFQFGRGKVWTIVG